MGRLAPTGMNAGRGALPGKPGEFFGRHSGNREIGDGQSLAHDADLHETPKHVDQAGAGIRFNIVEDNRYLGAGRLQNPHDAKHSAGETLWRTKPARCIAPEPKCRAIARP